MVRNSSTGIQLLFTSNHVSRSVNISNRYLPPECGDKDRCVLLQFESSGFSYYIIPSIRGFVTLSHGTDYEDVQTLFISTERECNPTQAFYDERSNNIVIACIDLQTRPRGIIHHLPYRFALNNDNTRIGSIIRNQELVIQSETIYNPETVSIKFSLYVGRKGVQRTIIFTSLMMLMYCIIHLMHSIQNLSNQTNNC